MVSASSGPDAEKGLDGLLTRALESNRRMDSSRNEETKSTKTDD